MNKTQLATELTLRTEITDIQAELEVLHNDESRIKSRISDLQTRLHQLKFELSGQETLPLDL